MIGETDTEQKDVKGLQTVGETATEIANRGREVHTGIEAAILAGTIGTKGTDIKKKKKLTFRFKNTNKNEMILTFLNFFFYFLYVKSIFVQGRCFLDQFHF